MPTQTTPDVRSPAIPPEHLEELKALFREDGLAVSDADALQAAQWLLARGRAVPFDLPAQMQALWDELAALAEHPHGRPSQDREKVLDSEDTQ